VSSQSQLTSTLGEILIGIQGNQPTHAKTAITNRTLSVTDRQYQFNASYSGTSHSPLDQVGHLDQFIYRCDDACVPEAAPVDEDDPCSCELEYKGASLCEIYSVSDQLNNRTEERKIYTQLDGEFEEFGLLNDAITADLLGIPEDGELGQLDPELLDDGQKLFSGIVLGDASDPLVREEYRRQLIKLVAGLPESRRENIKMGAIRNSQPVLQPNLFDIFAPIPSFTEYRKLEGVRDRPTVLFAGTHDGQMHAFRVDRLEGNGDYDEDDYGKELWAFIPKHLLPEFNYLATGMEYLMDGNPVVQEIRLYRNEALVELEDEVELWRSVLVSGYGDGGRGYFALDVTRPEEFSFMWEISNTEWCYNVEEASSGCVNTSKFERLGLSYSTPAIGSIFWNNGGKAEERAVVIFGGGEGIGKDKETGKSLYVVNLETGELLMEFCNSCGNVYDTNAAPENKEFLDCPLTGSVAAYDSHMTGIITRAFVGDSCGQLWRLDISDPNPEDWKLEFFHDGFDALSLKQKKVPTGFAKGKAKGHGYGWKKHVLRRRTTLLPSLAISERRGRLTIVYGTGDPDELLLPGASDRVFSLREEWENDGFTAEVNWKLELEKGEIFTSEALVYDKVAYFTTQTAGEGLCSTGMGRLWGLDFDGETDDDEDDVIGKMDEDGCTITTELVKYVEFEDAELSGFQLIQRPTCFGSPTDYMPWQSGVTEGSQKGSVSMPWSGGTGGGIAFGGASSAAPELVVQFGEAGVSSPEMSPPEGGGSISTGNKAVQKMTPPAQSVFSTSWGLVFD